MGQQLSTADRFTPSDRERYRTKVRRCLDALRTMVRDQRFAADEPRTGVEIELALVDERMCPAMLNRAVLDRAAADLHSPEVLTSELGRWNLEINLPPRLLPGASAHELESDVLDSISSAGACASSVGARAVTIGILPTLGAEHLESGGLTEDPRYALLNQQMQLARGEPFRLDITAPDDPATTDPEHLVLDVDTIVPEAACTSLQLHLQLTPDTFAAHWNAAQAVAGVQVALAANSPFLLGHRLWAETRVPLFTQAVDTRPVELRNQGVRPRVWFGDRWASCVEDLFEENLRYFSALLPIDSDEDPFAVLASGGAPALDELRLHNGTVWRWNRPVYDLRDGEAHLRLENRVLPAGPTAVDSVANAVFFYGLVRALAAAEHPPWQQMSFAAAEENFTAGARHGLEATQYWPGLGTVGVAELVTGTLLPLAREGLARWGVDPAVSRHYLDVVAQRCATRCTGSTWQVRTVAALEAQGATRSAAVRDMLARYVERSASNDPVHTWAV